MITASQNGSHSAIVRMTLQVADAALEVAQVTPNRIFLRTPVDLPPCEGILSISIDGHVTQRNIRLPDGASGESSEVLTAD
ncbi:MAG: hypothetical protein RIK87_21490 [Fuerstiella sp.]